MPGGVPVAAVALLLSMSAQQPRYVERVDVARVLIDARVVTDQGSPLTELTADDFKVKIDGKAARIESAQWLVGAPAAVDARAPASRAGEERQTGRPGRLIVFLLQKSLERSRIIGLMRLLLERRQILDAFGADDRVAVLSFEYSLRVWLDFTNDREQIDAVLRHGILFGDAPTALNGSPGLSLIDRLSPSAARRTYRIEDALRLLGDALDPLPGVKSVVLIGHGFGRLGPTGVAMEPGYAEARAALQKARASVFCLDVTDADYHSLEAGLQMVAGETGGLFVRTHIFTERALDLLVGALAGHYVLFVEKPDVGRGTHRIDVQLVRRKGNVLAKTAFVD